MENRHQDAREEAKKLGLKYYSGKVCVKCGSKRRYISGKGCSRDYCVPCNRKSAKKSLDKYFVEGSLWLKNVFLNAPCFYCRKKYNVLAMVIEHPISRRSQKRPLALVGRGSYKIDKLKTHIKKYKCVASCSNCNFAKMRTLDKGTPEGKRLWREYIREARANNSRHKQKDSKRSRPLSSRKSSRL